MKFLVLTSSFPYPLDVGRKVVLLGFLEFAISRLGANNVTLVCVSADESESQYIEECPCRVVFLQVKPGILRSCKILLQSLVLQRRTIQESLVYEDGARDQFNQLITEIKPDVVLVDTIRMAQYLESPVGFPMRSVLYLDDLYSLRYRRLIDAIGKFPEVGIDAVGTFSRFVPGPAQILTRSRTVQRLLLSREGKIISRREIAMPAQFDQVLLLNHEEAAKLSHDAHANNIAVVKPLLKRSLQRPTRRFNGEPTYIFLGNLSYSPNAYSMLIFLKRAMPQLVKQIPGCRLLIIGRGGNEALKIEASYFGPSVQFLGFVADLGDIMATAAAMIVPLVFGTGLKIKMLEALSSGVPVVSTPCGVDGLNVVNGRECFISEDLDGFTKPMARLLEPELNAQISRNAMDFYDTNFATAIVSQQYMEYFLGDLDRTN